MMSVLWISVDNGFNPVWNESCEFDVLNPQVAIIRFVVQDEDLFGDPNFLGQATIPVWHLRTGMLLFRHFFICNVFDGI